MRWLRTIRIVLLGVIDLLVPRRGDLWVFPSYFIGPGSFSDNARAVFEEVRLDPSIRKIVLRREASIEVDGVNIEILDVGSYRAAWRLMRAGVVFVQHSVWLDYSGAKLRMVAHPRRLIINLWHGIPIKDISHNNTGIHGRRGLREMSAYHVTCSSDEDMMHMRRAFHGTPENQFWVTGLPRSDTLAADEAALPASYRADLASLRSLKRGRRLVVYAPTYRETHVGGRYYAFSEAELDALETFCRLNDCVLAVRYHLYRRPDGYKDLVSRSGVIDLSPETFPDMRVVMREVDVLVTDYSSVFLDALYLDVPCLCFAFDRRHYESTQRGMFYSLEELFGDDIHCTLPSLMDGIEVALRSGRRADRDPRVAALSRRFFKWKDARNATRVVERVRTLTSRTG